ncbi:ester cyclase [Hyalangium gracile]|uniref:ester cyclase n=1 Tax=Hyalangium gracile TaxID=394092 RepID=UPI001CC9B370|nr:ester cyclase [Hyalangium gracile]
MSVHENKKLVRNFWEQVFNHGNMAPIDQLIGPDYTYNGQPGTASGTKAWAEALRKQLPDMHFTIEDLIGEEDKVAIRWTLVGTDSTSGQRVTSSATNIITLRHGRAISNWQNGGTSFQPVSSQAA